MRNRTRLGLLAALAAAVSLATPVAASGATATVRVGDVFFDPAVVRIAPGDAVNWVWEGSAAHTVATLPNQTGRFDSGPKTSGSFSRVFPTRGRFRYVCRIHPSMRGAIEVGPPPFPDTTIPSFGRALVTGFRGRAHFAFRLSEAATVVISVRGPSRGRYRGRLAGGRRTVTLRGLRPGRYRATLTATDRARNKGVTKGRFSVPR